MQTLSLPEEEIGFDMIIAACLGGNQRLLTTYFDRVINNLKSLEEDEFQELFPVLMKIIEKINPLLQKQFSDENLNQLLEAVFSV